MAFCERPRRPGGELFLLEARGLLRRGSGLSYLCLNSVEQGKLSAVAVD